MSVIRNGYRDPTPNQVLWWAVRWYAAETGRAEPDRAVILLPDGPSLYLARRFNEDSVEPWAGPAPSQWRFRGRYAEYGGTDDRFVCTGQHRELLEVLAGSAGASVPDEAVADLTTIRPTRLRVVVSELREVVGTGLRLADELNIIVRDGSGYRLTVV